MLRSSSSGGHGHDDHHHKLSQHHEDSLQIKQNDKFFSRLMSKETSMANSSSRVYYRTGASSSVPFMWESRPGTPKHTFNDTTLPPLTPPPSYLSGSGSKTNKLSKNMNGTNFFTFINVFPRLVVKKKKKKKKNHASPSSSLSFKSSSSSSWSSSSSSSASSTLSWSSSSCYSFSSCSRLHKNNEHNYDHDNDDGEQHAYHQDHDRGYSSSTTCFGVKDTSFIGSSRGRYSMVKMKNALRSIIVGRGSSGHQGIA